MRPPNVGRVSLVRRLAARERWLARSPRIAFWAVLAILAVGGLKQIVATTAETVGAEQGSGRVDQAAEELAQRFARAYLTYDVARPGPRERALAALLPDDLDPGAGFTPVRGDQRVVATEIAQHQEALAGGVVVVVATELQGRAEPVYLGVPVERRADGALAIAGYPSIVGPPAVARGSLPLREGVEDPAIAKVVERTLANYLAANRQNLAADLAAGAEVSPPAQRLRLVSVDELAWAQGPELGAVLATIQARSIDGSLRTLTYEIGIERIEADDRTTVTFIETVPTES